MSGWRPMSKSDLPWVNAIAAQVHPDYPESPLVFANRLELCPDGCWMAEDSALMPVGYAISHPGIVGHPPDLNTILPHLPPQADCLYLHDVALLDRARGKGLGKSIIPILDQVAARQGFTLLALTSVSGSHVFWSHYGFAPQPSHHLDSYGQALYMTRSVRS